MQSEKREKNRTATGIQVGKTEYCSGSHPDVKHLSSMNVVSSLALY